MAPLAYFGIESSGLNLVVDLLILFVVVLYLALIYWTYTDARRRIEDPMLVACATGAALFPFVGPVVYMVLRPPEYLEDVRERELETETAEARLAELQTRRCPHCEHPIELDFLRCPNCLRKLKERCASCSRPLDRAWAICPYCETEVAGGATARRGARRRAAAGEARTAVRKSTEAEEEHELTGIGPGSSRANRRAEDDAPRKPTAASEAARNPRTGRAPRPGSSPAPGS
jgi:Double zinc ribbon